MTDDRPAADLYDGCPNCKQSLRVEGSYVTCGNCGFKVATSPRDVQVYAAGLTEGRRHAAEWADVWAEQTRAVDREALLHSIQRALSPYLYREHDHGSECVQAAQDVADAILASGVLLDVADERERIAQAQEAFASDLRNAPDEDLTVPGWVVGVRLAARIAREGGADDPRFNDPATDGALDARGEDGD